MNSLIGRQFQKLRTEASERSSSVRLLFIAFALLLQSVGIFAGAFNPPEKITDGAQKYQLSRTADGIMAFDSTGRLHVIYWAGRLVTNPTTPSFIYYRSWRPGEGWTAQEMIDDSVVAAQHVGGRHPSLTVTSDDKVWIVWQDHRNCTPAGNWIDNTEIYGDFKPAAGSFSSSDIRLTTTTALHIGDNGYAPKIAWHPSGRLSLGWYDFNQDPNISDIYLKTSDTNGQFNLVEPIGGLRVTNSANRGGSPEFTVPDLAVDAAGTRHLVWAGGQGSGVNLYYAAVPVGSVSVTEQLLAAGATDFFDPPHITSAPNGDIWIAYADDTAVGGEDIVLMRRRAGQSSFDPKVTLPSNGFRQTFPDIKIDMWNKVHLGWVDDRSGTHVYYGLYDPDTHTLKEERITLDSRPWTRPSLAVSAFGNVYILFEESSGLASGDLWFTYKLNAARSWNQYE